MQVNGLVVFEIWANKKYMNVSEEKKYSCDKENQMRNLICKFVN